MRNTRTRIWSILLSLTMLLSLLPVTALADESENLETATLGTWVKDRTDPQSWSITDNVITTTVSVAPANDWYAWQGRKAATSADLTDYWVVKTQLTVTEDMMQTSSRRASVWVTIVDQSGAPIDWAILLFCNDGKSVRWQAWDSKDPGMWVDIANPIPTVGTHDLKIEYANGAVKHYIDDTLVRTNTLNDGQGLDGMTAPKDVIINCYSYGESYTTTWTAPTVTYAAGYDQDSTFVENTAELADALANAQDGDTIICMGGTYTADNTAPIVISRKNLTLKGTNGAKIQVTTGNQPIQMTGEGSTLEGFTIEKTDSFDQDIVLVRANNVSITGNVFSGQYTQGALEITRGILVSPGCENLNVTGNTFENLRQPMYIDGNVTGTISGNTVRNTRGFVVCGDSNVTLTDNQFADNAVDIAIIPNTNTVNNYTHIADLSAANTGAFVENQLYKASAKNGVIVVKADGGQYQDSLPAAIAAAQDGDTIRLESDIALDKMLDIAVDGIILDLNTHTITASEAFSYTYDNDRHLVNVSGDRVTIQNGALKTTDVNKHVLNLYEANGIILKDLTLDHTTAWKGAPLEVNSSTVTIQGKLNVVTGATSWYGIEADGKGDNAKIIVDENASIAFSGNAPVAGLAPAIKITNSGAGMSADITFKPNVTITTPEEWPDYTDVIRKSGSNVTVTNPENAGLEEDGNGSFVETFYTVKFVNDTTATSSVKANTQIVLPTVADKSGYVFRGWKSSADGLVRNAGTPVTITSDTTFTAVWNVIDYGGGSSSSSGDYIVSVDSTTGGKVTVNPSRADKGDTVTITVKPNDGYELDELFVTDKNGDTVKVTSKGNNKYTFTMPASKVTVEASFVKAGETNPSALPFTDVNVGDYFYDAVAWAVENGVTAGTSATTFSPNASCTRAQTVTFLWRAAGSPEPKTTSNPFTDVKESDYYYEAVLWAVENSITAGTSATTFSPNAVCTRGQVVTFLYRYDGTATATGTNFTDVSEGAYYYDAVQWAAQSGITTGTTATTFSPDANCTRGQIVTFLFRDLAE